MATSSDHRPVWWKEGVVYQVYPASFKDSNGDGVGDIPGIISKLDYIRDLGVDIIWVSPHYKSPQVDMGYDISDFQDIHEPYGTLKDCEDLIREVHARSMRIIFDLVINHTSDEHPLVQGIEILQDQPEKRLFTKPAWTWDEKTGEYYLHVYASGQPDLNWENADCRRALYDTSITFWLDRGVDGFRVDTVNKYSKVAGLPDAPVVEPGEETQIAVCHYANGPRIHEYLQEIKQVMSKYDVMTVGEIPNTPELADVLAYIAPEAGELDLVFKFDTVNLGQTPGNRFLPIPFDNSDFKRNFTKWQKLPETYGAWPTVFLENHDQGRSVSRFASDLPQYREAAAKMLATVLSTMTGTLFIYQGQEIGMINAPISWSAEEYKCVRSVNYYKDVCERTSNDPASLEQARANLHRVARDHARVPMQWDGTQNAGFCVEDANPWMSVLESHVDINVANQMDRKDSVLEFWRRVLKLRKKYAALFVYGTFELIEQHRDLLIFLKTEPASGHRAMTVANLSKTRVSFEEPPHFSFQNAALLVQNYTVDASNAISLGPFEARVYYLD